MYVVGGTYHERILVGIKPKEECPKPTTYADLFATERKIVEDACKPNIM